MCFAPSFLLSTAVRVTRITKSKRRQGFFGAFPFVARGRIGGAATPITVCRAVPGRGRPAASLVQCSKSLYSSCADAGPGDTYTDYKNQNQNVRRPVRYQYVSP